MTDFEHAPDRDAVFFECRSRQLVPRLQTVRDAILALKEEAMDTIKQQWARSGKDNIITTFALIDKSILTMEDELANMLFLIRELKMYGQSNQHMGISDQDV